MTSDRHPFYQEEQYFRQVWWVMLLILGTTALMWWGFIQQIVFERPWGTNPAPDWAMWLLWLLIGIGLPALFLSMGLIVAVYPDKLSIKYKPFYQRSIRWEELVAVKALDYNPIRQYGGWGIRGFGNNRAYSVKGSLAVELVLEDGHRVLIGTQNPEELAAAIESQRSS